MKLTDILHMLVDKLKEYDIDSEDIKLVGKDYSSDCRLQSIAKHEMEDFNVVYQNNPLRAELSYCGLQIGEYYASKITRD